MSGLTSRIAGWLRRNMPRREQLEGNRFIRPFAQRPELWRFTRRSVPRGVAVGLLVGIFALIPGVQIIGAALMCVPCRANIPLAAATTFLSNPATTPFILAASIYVGNSIGYHADLATLKEMYARGAGLGEWGYWLVSDAAPALLFGLFAISTVAAALGYLLSSWIWRAWVGRKNRARQQRYMEREGELL
jgi:uncharacterized protein (DUF2062 family)